MVSHNISIRPTLLNEFRFGFTHTLLTPNFPIQGAAAIAQLGLQNVDVSHHPTDGGFPSINFSDGTGFTPIGRDHVGPTLSSTNQIADNLTYIKGKHTIRTGADVRWVRFAVPEIETRPMTMGSSHSIKTNSRAPRLGTCCRDFRIPHTLR